MWLKMYFHPCVETSIKLSCYALFINVDSKSVIVSQRGLSSSHITMPLTFVEGHDSSEIATSESLKERLLNYTLLKRL
jgi:hypothetical protein